MCTTVSEANYTNVFCCSSSACYLLYISTVSFKKLSLHQMFSSLYTGWLLISSRGWFLAAIYMTTVVMRRFECSSTRGFCIVSIPSNQTSATAPWTTFKSLMVNLSTGDYRLSVTNVSTPETWKTSDRALSFYRWIFLFLFTNPCIQILNILACTRRTLDWRTLVICFFEYLLLHWFVFYFLHSIELSKGYSAVRVDDTLMCCKCYCKLPLGASHRLSLYTAPYNEATSSLLFFSPFFVFFFMIHYWTLYQI